MQVDVTFKMASVCRAGASSRDLLPSFLDMTDYNAHFSRPDVDV